MQNGCQFELSVIEYGDKGKGCRTDEFIPAGSFVIEYLGELLASIDDAERVVESRSGEPNYVMFLREHFNSKTTTTIIDARNYSNKARFINHSCEPNLFLLPVRIDNLVPHAALFASRDIESGEELSYDYNGSVGKHTDEGECDELVEQEAKTACYCDAKSCRKFLPNKY